MSASKTKRLLYFMSELDKGNEVFKDDYLAKFAISDRTMKEDASELKETLEELYPHMILRFARKEGKYYADYDSGYAHLTYQQALVLSKILLESRALRKEEVWELTHRLFEQAMDAKECQQIKQFIEAELETYEELKWYQETNQSLIPLLSQIYDAIMNQQLLTFHYGKTEGDTKAYTVLPISVILDKFHFYCVSYQLADDLSTSFELSNLRYFRLDRLQAVHQSEENASFSLSPDQVQRLVTAEQVRYQAFSMLSGNQWVRIDFEYTGHQRERLETHIPRLQVLDSWQKEGLEKVHYSLETFSLLGFQKYIQSFEGDFVFLKIEPLDK